jgi:hypothetical protein
MKQDVCNWKILCEHGIIWIFFIVNVILKNQIQWLDEEDVIRLWHDSKILCGLPLIYGVINYN